MGKMNDITPKEASEILSHYTDLGYGIIIEGEDTSKIKQALSLARKTLTNGTPYEERPQGDLISREALKANMKKAEEQADTFEMLVEFYEQIIDNAPTVVVDCKNCDGYEAGYSAGVRDTERPQGEIFPMELVAGKCPIDANGDCPLRTKGGTE